MTGLTYFAGMVVLFAALIFGQSSTSTPSDASNSSNRSAQTQNSTTDFDQSDQVPNTRHEAKPARHESQATGEQEPSRSPSTTTPGTSTDQQPNSWTNPTPAPPQAYLNQTPAARAVATHTPDPGTCMNPAALGTGQAGTQPRRGSPCD